jgi:TolA-binding protein
MEQSTTVSIIVAVISSGVTLAIAVIGFKQRIAELKRETRSDEGRLIEQARISIIIQLREELDRAHAKIDSLELKQQQLERMIAALNEEVRTLQEENKRLRL